MGIDHHHQQSSWRYSTWTLRHALPDCWVLRISRPVQVRRFRMGSPTLLLRIQIPMDWLSGGASTTTCEPPIPMLWTSPSPAIWGTTLWSKQPTRDDLRVTFCRKSISHSRSTWSIRGARRTTSLQHRCWTKPLMRERRPRRCSPIALLGKPVSRRCRAGFAARQQGQPCAARGPVPANPTATQNIYDMYNCFAGNETLSLEILDAFCFPGVCWTGNGESRHSSTTNLNSRLFTDGRRAEIAATTVYNSLFDMPCQQDCSSM